jgi:hypothetical protein
VLKDNGTQLKGAKFIRCYIDFGIHHQPSSTAYPQMNGQVERANRLILHEMKTRMFHDLEEIDRHCIRSCPQCCGLSVPISAEQLEIIHSI